MATSKVKKKMVRFLDMGTFPGTVLFSAGFTTEEFYAHIEKNYKTGRWAKQDGSEIWLDGIRGEKAKFATNNYWAAYRRLEHPKHGKKNCFYILIFDEFKFTDEEMIKLAHECLHICQFYLPDVLNRDQEIEAEAYLHSHLMRQCLKELRE